MPKGTQGPKKAEKFSADDPNYNAQQAVKNIEELDWSDDEKKDLVKYVDHINKIARLRTYLEPAIKGLSSAIGGAFEKNIMAKMSQLDDAINESAIVVGQSVVWFQGGIDKQQKRTLKHYQEAFKQLLVEEGRSAEEIEKSFERLEQFVQAKLNKPERTHDKLSVVDASEFLKQLKPQNESQIKEGVVSDVASNIGKWLLNILNRNVGKMAATNKKLKSLYNQMIHDSTVSEAKTSMAKQLGIKYFGR